jgi:hypothetical protein
VETYAEKFGRRYMTDPDDGLRLLYQWVKTGVISQREFNDCMRYICSSKHGSGT